ncbi:MAG TPA: hypothetical protein V6C57_02330 [Coleofasciculaceae cyanobacterium]
MPSELFKSSKATQAWEFGERCSAETPDMKRSPDHLLEVEDGMGYTPRKTSCHLDSYCSGNI